MNNLSQVSSGILTEYGLMVVKRYVPKKHAKKNTKEAFLVSSSALQS